MKMNPKTNKEERSEETLTCTPGPPCRWNLKNMGIGNSIMEEKKKDVTFPRAAVGEKVFAKMTCTIIAFPRCSISGYSMCDTKVINSYNIK